MKKKEKISILEDIFERVVSPDGKVRKQAKNDLEKYFHKSDGRGGSRIPIEFVTTQMRRLDTVKNPQSRAALVSTMYFPCLEHVRKDDMHYRYFADFFIKTIQDESGYVRQATLHAAGWMRLLNGLGKFKIGINEKSLQKFISQIDEIIEKHKKGIELEEYLEDLKPSIFKSACMLHREMAFPLAEHETDAYTRIYYEWLEMPEMLQNEGNYDFVRQKNNERFILNDENGITDTNNTKEDNFMMLLAPSEVDSSKLKLTFDEPIKNPKRKKCVDVFQDTAHRISTAYFDVMETIADEKILEQKMRNFINVDPFYFDTFMSLAYALREQDKNDNADSVVADAYYRACMRIADKNGNWPKYLPWVWLENRHIMRAIGFYAHMMWEKGEIKLAQDIFSRLLHANPEDNQGNRYCLLAILLNLGIDWDEQFVVKDGPMVGEALNAIAVDNWFEENAKKFPDEFDWLFEEWKKFE